MRTRSPSLTFLQERPPEFDVMTGGCVLRLGAVLFTGGGGKLRATGSGSSRFIQEGTNRLAGSRFSVGRGGGFGPGTTMVPSAVREQAASDSIMPPATNIVPNLRAPSIENPTTANLPPS